MHIYFAMKLALLLVAVYVPQKYPCLEVSQWLHMGEMTSYELVTSCIGDR